MKHGKMILRELHADIPVIQGGMGVGISLSGLAGAVAAAGGIGIISTAQIGFREPDFDRDPIACNLRTIGKEIEQARQIARGGIVGVNIMVATQRYEDYVRAAVLAGTDCIISGAGLPLDLPGIVAEGPLAGGHLGFKREELDAYTPQSYERELTAMIRQAAELEIPLIAAGGIYDRRDLEHCLSLGAVGVQMGTRFVTTEECDAADAYKQAYLSARKEDIVIVKSPVGMPGRAIQNAFLEKVAAGERFMTGCRHCIKTCDPKTAPYCITRALINAATGDVDNGLLFCGSNAWRAQKIERTVDIMEEMA